MLSKFLDLVAPPLCIACHADARAAAPLCRDCRALMQAAGGGWIRIPTGAAAWAAFPYEGPAGALVRALKFEGRLAIADAMAAQLAALAPAELLRGVVVPVPVHPAHRRRRGIDHSGALARAFAKRAGLPLADCLVRGGDPRPQVGRGRGARLRGPLGSIALRSGARAPGAALLVDDVITTGATLAACASALRAGGTEGASLLVYARTTGR